MLVGVRTGVLVVEVTTLSSFLAAALSPTRHFPVMRAMAPQLPEAGWSPAPEQPHPAELDWSRVLQAGWPEPPRQSPAT